jgi:hypothetical protein
VGARGGRAGPHAGPAAGDAAALELDVVAQREAKRTLRPLDTDDNFHVKEIRRRPETAA